MVDAIDAVNAATNTRILQNQDYSRDWKNLTASEVLEYARQGDEVPVDILKWAEDYSKLTNVPDDVTYESVNGSTDADEVRGDAGAEDAQSAEDVEDESEVSESDSGEDEQKDEENLYDKAGRLIPESNQATGAVTDMTNDVNNKVHQGERAANQAQQKADTTESQTKWMKSEYDKLVKKLEGDKSKITPSDLLKLDRLAGMLTSIGTRAQNELSVYDIQLQEIEQVFSQYEPIPANASTKGTETIETGAKLTAISPQNEEEIKSAAADHAGDNAAKAALKKVHRSRWQFIFDRNYQMGIDAIKAGGSAVDAGANGTNVLSEANSSIETSHSTVNDAIDRVEDATLVSGNNIELNQEDNNTDRRHKNDRSGTTNSTQNKTSENNTDDTNIQANDLAIKKRKEQRGEVENA